MRSREFLSLRSTIQTRFGDIARVQKGSGPAALFVHGVLQNGYLWRNVIDKLATHRTCVAVDLMGHGATRVAAGQDLSLDAQAEMLVAFIDALGLDRVDLIGNDSGGGIVQIFAARYPERTRTVLLTNSDVHDNVFPPAFLPIYELIRGGKLLEAFRPLLENVGAARAAFGSVFEHPERISEETFRMFLEPLVENEECGRCIQRWMEAFGPEPLLRIESDLRRLHARTLIVWGTADVYFDVKWAYWLKDAIPGALGVVEVPGGKLYLPEERSALLAAQIRALWGENPVARGWGPGT